MVKMRGEQYGFVAQLWIGSAQDTNGIPGETFFFFGGSGEFYLRSVVHLAESFGGVRTELKKINAEHVTMFARELIGQGWQLFAGAKSLGFARDEHGYAIPSACCAEGSAAELAGVLARHQKHRSRQNFLVVTFVGIHFLQRAGEFWAAGVAQ